MLTSQLITTSCKAGVAIAALVFVGSFAPSASASTSISNFISSHVNSGGTISHGKDGEDGKDGTSIVTGNSESSVSIETVINGEVVESYHKTIQNGEVVEESHVHEHDDGHVETHIDAHVASSVSEHIAEIESQVETWIEPEVFEEKVEHITSEPIINHEEPESLDVAMPSAHVEASSVPEKVITSIQTFITSVVAYVFNIFS